MTEKTMSPTPQPTSPPNNPNDLTNLTITLLPDPTPLHPTAHSTWHTLFSNIGPTSPHPSPTTFAQHYTPPTGAFLLASTPLHPVAGTIAYRTYDNRFSQPELDFSSYEGQGRVVEVARLHVLPELRGRGVATRLVRRLVEVARGEGVRVLYLHTHPFLEGAEELWVKEGWRVVCREEEGPWFTVHLRRDL